jgi:hypothetical protein
MVDDEAPRKTCKPLDDESPAKRKRNEKPATNVALKRNVYRRACRL